VAAVSVLLTSFILPLRHAADSVNVKG
jgi:hypothetical protein